jgi:parallel beta-helix repeat protein
MFYFLLLVLSTLLALTNSAYAATYWVAKTGSDSHTCAQAQTQSTPKLTITSGNACLSAGDTLMVKAGTYTYVPPLYLKGGTSWTNPVTYMAHSGETVTLAPSAGSTGALYVNENVFYVIVDSFVIDATNVQDGIGIAGTHVRIQNTEVKNAPGNGVSSGTGPKFIELLNMHVHHNGTHPNCASDGPPLFEVIGPCHGVYMYSDDMLFDGGRYHDNQSYGLHIYPGGSRVTIRNVRSYNNGDTGIGMFYGSNNKIYNNVIYNNGSGIWANSGNSQWYNNTIYGNTRSGIYADGSEGIFRNNIVYNNDGGNIQNLGNNILSNNLTTNPLFVNTGAGDFHLQSGSAAINAGQAISEITADFDGILRPQGPGYDIGAYEYLVGKLSPPSNLRISAP